MASTGSGWLRMSSLSLDNLSVVLTFDLGAGSIEAIVWDLGMEVE